MAGNDLLNSPVAADPLTRLSAELAFRSAAGHHRPLRGLMLQGTAIKRLGSVARRTRIFRPGIIVIAVGNERPRTIDYTRRRRRSVLAWRKGVRSNARATALRRGLRLAQGHPSEPGPELRNSANSAPMTSSSIRPAERSAVKRGRSGSPRQNCTPERCCRQRSWPVRRPAHPLGSPPGSAAIGEMSTRCADNPSPTSCCRRR